MNTSNREGIFAIGSWKTALTLKVVFFLMKNGLISHLNKTDKIFTTGVKRTCTLISRRTNKVKKGHVLGWTGER